MCLYGRAVLYGVWSIFCGEERGEVRVSERKERRRRTLTAEGSTKATKDKKKPCKSNHIHDTRWGVPLCLLWGVESCCPGALCHCHCRATLAASASLALWRATVVLWPWGVGPQCSLCCGCCCCALALVLQQARPRPAARTHSPSHTKCQCHTLSLQAPCSTHDTGRYTGATHRHSTDRLARALSPEKESRGDAYTTQRPKRVEATQSERLSASCAKDCRRARITHGKRQRAKRARRTQGTAQTRSFSPEERVEATQRLLVRLLGESLLPARMTK